MKILFSVLLFNFVFMTTAFAFSRDAEMATGDLNGDGFADIVVGVPLGKVNNKSQAGSVTVNYGSASGISGEADEVWNQDSLGVRGVAEKNDYFGDALIIGDLNNDGFDDLVVGAPGEDINSVYNVGMVHIIYGSATGLTAQGNQVWNQDTGNMLGTSEPYDSFGQALEIGDFNNDGNQDLIIGVKNKDVEGVYQAGMIKVIYGTSTGLNDQGNQEWHQNSGSIIGTAEYRDRFGRNLAVGDLNNDGYDDVVIGGQFEDVNGEGGAGLVNVIYGSSSGLTDQGNQVWHQDSAGIIGVAESADYFAHEIVVGDLNNDGYDDLAVGSPYEGMSPHRDSGVVNIIYGSNSGLTAQGNQVWHQNQGSIKGVNEWDDHFADSLAIGDLNNDGYGDLVVGVADEDLANIWGAGMVHIIYGSILGLTDANNEVWHQASGSIRGAAESGDRFGSQLAIGDLDNDGFDDLFVGVPGEDIANYNHSYGIINIIKGSTSGLTDVNNSFLYYVP